MSSEFIKKEIVNGHWHPPGWAEILSLSMARAPWALLFRESGGPLSCYNLLNIILLTNLKQTSRSHWHKRVLSVSHTFTGRITCTTCVSDSRSPTSHTFHCKAPGPRFQCPITENSFLQIFDQRFAHRSYYSTSWLQNLFYVARMALFLLQLKVENIIYTPFEIFGIMSVCPSLKHCFNGMLAKFSTSQPDKVKVTVNLTIEAIRERFVELTKSYALALAWPCKC